MLGSILKIGYKIYGNVSIIFKSISRTRSILYFPDWLRMCWFGTIRKYEFTFWMKKIVQSCSAGRFPTLMNFEECVFNLNQISDNYIFRNPRNDPCNFRSMRLCQRELLNRSHLNPYKRKMDTSPKWILWLQHFVGNWLRSFQHRIRPFSHILLFIFLLDVIE